MKRMIAWTMALLLLLGALPLTVAAAESEELLLGGQLEFYVASGEEIACHYTAEEAGTYVLECPYGEWDYYAKRLDAEGNVLEETDHFAIEPFEMELAAGETVYFVCGAVGDFEGGMYLPLYFWKVIPVTGMDLCDGRDSITLPLFGGQTVVLGYEPANATPVDIAFAAEDEFMLDVYAWGDNEIQLYGYEVGETTLTVTVDGQHTDTITVYVEEPGEWGDLGTRSIILSPYRQSRTYHFTPEEDGWYEIFSEGNNDDPHLEIWAYDEENEGYYEVGSSDDTMDYNFGWHDYFEAGVDYYLVASAYSGFSNALAYSMTVQKAEEPEEPEELPDTGIGFYEDSLTVAVGEFFFPDGWLGVMDYAVGIESSDEEVVSADLMDGCYALKAGEVTLTVTAESGASDTIAITVVEPPVLVLNQRTAVTLMQAEMGKRFWFTPEESGTYIFRSFSDKDPYIAVYNEEGELLEENDDSQNGLNFYMELKLTAGETYAVEVSAYEAHTYEFLVAKSVPATNLTLSIPERDYSKKVGDTYYVPLGGDAFFHVAFGEAPGAAEEWVEITLSDGSLMSGGEHRSPYWQTVGQTTVTVESESGLSDTITVVVYGYLPGDYNLNGRIDQGDLAALKAYLDGADDEFFFLLDVNEDGVVDAEDEVALGEMMPFQFLWGDVDGDETITSTDARLTLQYYAGKITEEDLNIDLADVDGDGDITSTDARLILQYYAGKIEDFPIQTLAEG